MTHLESWIKQATRGLGWDSTLRVRREIEQHYESAKEAAMSAGETAAQADYTAVMALGDPKQANCQYREVLLTSSEVGQLRQEKCFFSRRWMKWALLAVPVATLATALRFAFDGSSDVARILFAASIGMAILFGIPFLPVYTPRRSRIFRGVKWVVMIGMLTAAFGPDTFKMSWLLFSCLWPMAWIEFKRMSIRRKLPVSQWPKQLYL